MRKLYNMKKNLEHFLTLPYRIELQPILAENGGGFVACIPLLGRYAVQADGETPDEALEKLEEIKRERLSAYLESGVSIPEPEPEENFSGKFVLRIPRYLHRELAQGARKNSVSLNQFITSLLSRALEVDEFSFVRKDSNRKTERFSGGVQLFEYSERPVSRKRQQRKYTRNGEPLAT